jgi:AraC-like DNA-binding protein
MLAFGTIAVMLHSLRKQRDVAMREVAVLSQRIGEIENNIKDQENTSEKVEPVDLSQVTEEALFQHITAIIKDEELFLQPTFGRAEVMERFGLSAARVGAAFSQGGGQSVSEFVRSCRLGYACRLIVERPQMNFVDVGLASGFKRTTTFYHDFKAQYGMTPAEYRAAQSFPKRPNDQSPKRLIKIMKTRNNFNWVLMAAAVLGLGMSVASCTDNIDNNSGKTPEEQEEVVQSKADKYWSVVSQLVSLDDITEDYEGKTFEPVYGVAQEGDPSTRLVYTNDLATAAERFADIVEVEGIDKNTQTYTFDDPDIGTLTYTKGDEEGAILATVDVNIKQIPSLKKIIYVPGGLSNGHFEGKAYYRFGDVVSRQTTDYDGNAATEYWVCVRPAFGPEGKEESHWVCLNVLPKKNVYHYKGSNGTDYYLPTGIGTNKEQMQNLAEMIYAITYPSDWDYNVSHNSNGSLKMFHDFSHSNIKYHNEYFWQNVQNAWRKKGIFRLALNIDEDDLYNAILNNGLNFLYSGYSWWTKTSWYCKLWTASFTHDFNTVEYFNLHKSKFGSLEKNMRNLRVDCRIMGDSTQNYSDFLGSDSGNPNIYWAVRHATGKELCANGRYDVKQPLNDCSEVYRYYHDVNPVNDLTTDPEETIDPSSVTNAPTDGSGTYMLGDVVIDQNDNKWICINGSARSPSLPQVANDTAWFVSFDFNEMEEFGSTVDGLPKEDELPELAVRLMDGFITTIMEKTPDDYQFNLKAGELGRIMNHIELYTHRDWRTMIVARDSTWTFTSKGQSYNSQSQSFMFCLAYDDGNKDKQAIARIICDNTQSGSEQTKCIAVRADGTEKNYNMPYTRIDKYYHTYDPSKMRQMTEDEKSLGMNTWCLPWAVTSEKMYLQDLEDLLMVARYGKSDKWVTLGSQPRTEVVESAQPDDFICNPPRKGMYYEPVLFLRVMKVIDTGGRYPNLKSTNGHALRIVHMQNDAFLYNSNTQSLQWLLHYLAGRKNVYVDNVKTDIPIIPGTEGL